MFTNQKIKYDITADSRGLKSELGQIDSMIGRVGGSFSSLAAGPIGAAAVGVGAIAAAAATAGVALFNLTKTAADYGSTIFDASKKTGLGAEALSAMDFAAKQSGTSMEAITGGVAKFAKTVGAASEDTKKATQFLKDFGITPQEAIKDLDGALGKVFKKIIDAPPGIERITLAQKAFGKSGADLLPFLDSFDGDLGKLIRKAKELGVTIDDETAKAADEFGDQLDTLSAQFAGAGRAIAGPFMKPFTEMAKAVSEFLVENKDEIGIWGDRTALTLQGLILQWKELKKAADNYGASSAMGAIGRLNPAYQVGAAIGRDARRRAIEANQITSRADLLMREDTNLRISPFGDSGAGGDGGGGGKASKKIADKLPAFGSMKSLVISSGNPQWDTWFNQMGQKYNVDPNVLLLQVGAESSFKSGAVSPKGAKGFSQFMPGTAARFGVDTSSVKDSIRGQAQYMGQLLSMFGGDYRKALAGYNAGEGAVEKYGGIPPYRETRGYVSKIQGQYRSRVRKADGSGYGTFNFDEQAEAARQFEEDLEALGQKALDEMMAAERQASDDRLSLRRDEADRAAEIIGDQVDKGIFTEEEGIKKLGQLKVDLLKAERKETGDQISSKENLLKLRSLDLKIQTQELANTRELAAAEKKRRDEQNKSLKEWFENLKKVREEEDKAARRRYEQGMFTGEGTLGGGIAQGAGAQLAPMFDNATNAMLSFQDRLALVHQDMNNFVGQGIGGLIEGLAAMGVAWLVTGEFSAKAALQMAAGAALGIAIQAGIKALFEFAEAAAAAATGNVYGAAAHTAAGYLYLGVAASAAAIGTGLAFAGRAVGGGSGDRASGGGGESQTTNYGGTRREEDLRPISRVSDDAYISGRRTDPATAALIRAVEKLDKRMSKFDVARPGDVIMRGFKEKRGIVANQFSEDVKNNSGLGTKAARTLGLR